MGCNGRGWHVGVVDIDALWMAATEEGGGEGEVNGLQEPWRTDGKK